MRGMFNKLRVQAVRLLRRFLSNEPANTYERIVFTAVRDAALNFGGRILA